MRGVFFCDAGAEAGYAMERCKKSGWLLIKISVTHFNGKADV
jgi:hypothetical protein